MICQLGQRKISCCLIYLWGYRQRPRRGSRRRSKGLSWKTWRSCQPCCTDPRSQPAKVWGLWGSLIYPWRPFRVSVGSTLPIKVKCVGPAVESVSGVESTIHSRTRSTSGTNPSRTSSDAQLLAPIIQNTPRILFCRALSGLLRDVDSWRTRITYEGSTCVP